MQILLSFYAWLEELG